MTAVLNVNAQNLDTAFIESIKSRFSTADLEIRVKPQADKKPIPLFSTKDFWETIAQLDWAHENGDDEQVLAPAVAFLAQRPLEHIYRFADLLAEKLWHLDTQAHAQVFLDDPASAGYLSVDDFLYARCAVVANGLQTYENVLQNPSQMPTDITFEPLLGLAAAAHRRKTGRDTLIVSAYNYETYSNRKGWNH